MDTEGEIREERSYQLELKIIDMYGETLQSLYTFLLTIPALIALIISRDYIAQISGIDNYPTILQGVRNIDTAIIIITFFTLVFVFGIIYSIYKILRLRKDKINDMIDKYKLNVVKESITPFSNEERIEYIIVFFIIFSLLFIFNLIFKENLYVLILYPLIISILIMSILIKARA